MWPLKKRERMTVEEFVATKPPAPCGDQKTHYYWTEIEGWKCPCCAAIEKQQREQKERELLANMIADAVIAKMNNPPREPGG